MDGCVYIRQIYSYVSHFLVLYAIVRGNIVKTEYRKNRRYMKEQISKDPCHGVTLEMMLKMLVEQYGWEEMGRIVSIKCFQKDPSVRSSLTFLRKTPWARKKVEELYVRSRTRKN